MDYLIETYHKPSTKDDFVKVQDTTFDNYLTLSIPDQLFKNQHTSINNMLFKNNSQQQSTQNQGYQHENLINYDCDQLIRSIDQNTELKVHLKSKSIYITVTQTQSYNMNAIVNQQKESVKRNNRKVYKGKVKDAKMDGYMKGLFYDVVSLFIHLKFTDQLQFMVVKNQKKIISLSQNRDRPFKKLQNQEYFQYFLNFCKNQILPGDRLVKSVCSIGLSKISTQQEQIDYINENIYKIRELKIQQLIAKKEQLQNAVKNYKIQNERLQKKVQNLNKFIKIHQNKNYSQQQFCQINQIDRNQIQLHKQEKELQKRDLKQKKRNKKQQQKKTSMKREILQIPIERIVKNIKTNLNQDIQEDKNKKLQKQPKNQQNFEQKNQFRIQFENSIKKDIGKQYIQDQNTLKKEQLNLYQIISQNTKNTQNPLNFSFSNQKPTLNLNNYLSSDNLLDNELNQLSQGHATSNLGLTNKHIQSQETPRKIKISGDSYLKISQQVQLISVPCNYLIIRFQVQNFIYRVLYSINQEFDQNFKSCNVMREIVIIILFRVNLFLILECIFILSQVGIVPLALSIQNNKNITEFIKILSFEHSHGLGAYNNEFQPLINLVNKDLLKLQQVIVSYPNYNKNCTNKKHWTVFLRKEISVYLLGNYKFS